MNSTLTPEGALIPKDIELGRRRVPARAPKDAVRVRSLWLDEICDPTVVPLKREPIIIPVSWHGQRICDPTTQESTAELVAVTLTQAQWGRLQPALRHWSNRTVFLSFLLGQSPATPGKRCSHRTLLICWSATPPSTIKHTTIPRIRKTNGIIPRT